MWRGMALLTPLPPLAPAIWRRRAGSATGTEWTGLVTGLVWAGARQVVTTTVPVIEDSLTAALDAELLDSICSRGAVQGLLNWQRSAVARWRDEPSNPATAPYRWTETVAVRSGDLDAPPMDR
jgi:hypothetical protein